MGEEIVQIYVAAPMKKINITQKVKGLKNLPIFTSFTICASDLLFDCTVLCRIILSSGTVLEKVLEASIKNIQ